MNKQKQFNTLAKDIKSVKIQGATNVAKAALKAYSLIPTKNSKRILMNLRPTEPLLFNILNNINKMSAKEILNHISNSKEPINKTVFKIIKNNSIILTHCHSSTVTNALIYSKRKGKKFEVYNLETRPLYQGRKTLLELKKAGIKVTMFVDSAVKVALTKDQDKEEKTKPVDIILIGADAITDKGVANKIGSGMLSEIAKDNHIPLYVIADSWKYSKKPIKLEQRNPKEVWNKSNANIKNPAFELIPKNNITKIISELGILSFNEFLRKVK